MFHTQPWTGAEIYRLVAELTQNDDGHTFKDNSEVWNSVSKEHKPLYQGTINSSFWEDNMCDLEEQQHNWICTFRIGVVNKEYQLRAV
jgi:hypothetical protein